MFLKRLNINTCTQDKVTPKIVIEILLLTGGSALAFALSFPFGFGAVSAKLC